MKSVFLLIDTSVFSSSLALWVKETDSVIMLKGSNRNYAEQLPADIPVLLDTMGCKMNDLKAVGVCSGPGSYTGLRLGVSLAKGLSMGLSVPLIAVSRLQLLANIARKKFGFSSYILPVIDAGRMEVYVSKVLPYESVSFNEEALILTGESFSELSGHEVVFLGSGAAKCKELFSCLSWSYKCVREPDASDLCEPVWEAFSNHEFADANSFEPTYLKEYQPAISSK